MIYAESISCVEFRIGPVGSLADLLPFFKPTGSLSHHRTLCVNPAPSSSFYCLKLSLFTPPPLLLQAPPSTSSTPPLP